MILPYKKISVIWGGDEAKQQAQMVKEIGERYHIEEKYPVVVEVLNEGTMPNKITEKLMNVFKNSDFVIAILSLTDNGARIGDEKYKKRLRQNVVLEIGVAISIVKDIGNKMLFLSNFDKTDDVEIPSDMMDIPFNRITDEQDLEYYFKIIIKDKLRLKSNKDLFYDTKYNINFNDLSLELDSELMKSNDVNGIKELFDTWQSNQLKFDFENEKSMYLLERLRFFPEFSRNEKMRERFKAWKNEFEISPTKDEYNELDDIIKDLTIIIMDYTIYRMDEQKQDEAEGFRTFKEQMLKVKRMLKKYKENNNVEYNPVILFNLYGYLGLTMMHEYMVTDDKESVDINEIVNYLNQTYAYAKKIDNGIKIFSGFAAFDVARGYEKIYRIKKEKEIYDEVLDMFDASLKAKEKWNMLNMPPFFVNALAYEYFKTSTFKLDFIKEFSTVDKIKAECDRILLKIAKYELQFERINKVREAVEQVKNGNIIIPEHI